MVITKKLISLVRKWQKLAAFHPTRISNSSSESTISTVKGHFVVYTADQRRFVLPLEFLKNEIVKELFRLAEEEFGLPSDRPLRLPCDAGFMEYVIALI